MAQSEGEYPALMLPIKPGTFETLADGKDIECKRIGADFTYVYGLEPSGFGMKIDQDENE